MKTKWIRAGLYYGDLRGEFMYRIRAKDGTVVEGYSSKRFIAPTVPIYESAKKRKARVDSGDKFYTYWGALEVEVVREDETSAFVITPDNIAVHINPKRFLTERE